MDYYLYNMSRAPSTRVQRYTSPQHRSAMQFVGDRRLLRGRPLVIHEAELLKNLTELQKQVDAGLLEVRTVDGRIFNLKTLKPEGSIPPAPMVPHPVQDSVKNDPPSGIPMPIYPGGAVQSIPVEPTPAPEEEEADLEFQENSSGSGRKGKKGRR